MGKEISTKILIPVLFFVLCIVPLVSSASVQINPQTNIGISVDYIKYDYIKANSSFSVNIHAFNITDGKPLTNSTTNCSLHFYGLTGEHLASITKLPFTTADSEWETVLTAGNFSQVGQHQFIIWCVNNEAGGFASGLVNVEYSGYTLSTPQAILDSVAIFLLVILFLGMIMITFRIDSSAPKSETGEILGVNNMKYAKVGMMLLSYGVLVVIMFLVSNVFMAYLNSVMLGKFFFILFKILMRLLYLFVVLGFIWALVQLFQDSALKKLIQRGYEFK